MKIAVLLALVACISSTCGVPAPQAVDWYGVRAKVDEICLTYIPNMFYYIKTIASDDNAEVGASIGSQLDTATEKIFWVYEELRREIDSETLTETKAKEFFTMIRDIYFDLQHDLQDELAQLSSEVSYKIRDLSYELYAFTENFAQQIYALLAAPLSFTHGSKEWPNNS